MPELAGEAGLDGIVCSGAEVAAARDIWRRASSSFLDSPEGADMADQKRVVTPCDALDDGASVLVIGRPITAAGDPARRSATSP